MPNSIESTLNDPETQFQEKQRNVVKEISRKMILQSRINRLTENFAKLFLLSWCLYAIHHLVVFGHIFHFH